MPESTANAVPEANSATRVLRAYDAVIGVQGVPNDASFLARWARAFEVDGGPSEEDQVVVLLQALRSEIDVTRTAAIERGIAAELLDPGFAHFLGATSIARLSNPWANLAGNITPPHIRLPFAWCDWALRDTAEIEQPAEIGVLSDLLDELETVLKDADLQPFVRAFTQRQVDAIRNALRLYRVSGAKAVKAALRSVVGDYATSTAALSVAAQSANDVTKSAMSKGAALVEKAAKVCDNFSKLVKAGKEVGELGASVAVYVGPLIAMAQSLN
jgi:hypothetical protein